MKKREIEVIINFTEGWEERVTKAAYNLYLRLEAQNNQNNIKPKETKPA